MSNSAYDAPWVVKQTQVMTELGSPVFSSFNVRFLNHIVRLHNEDLRGKQQTERNTHDKLKDNISVTKKFHFCYGHHLRSYEGDCANNHGHNSTVEVEFVSSGDMPPAPDGMVVDFKRIKTEVQPIIDTLDHKNLNELSAFGDHGDNPTAENIAVYIAREILKTEIGCGLVRVLVTESDDSCAEWCL